MNISATLSIDSATPADLQSLLTGLQQVLVANLLQQQLGRIEQKLDAAKTQESSDMAILDDKIQALTDQVTRNTTVIGGAKTMISGFSQQLADAVTAAKAAGASDAQLQSLTDLGTALKSSDDDLAAAIAANTTAPLAA